MSSRDTFLHTADWQIGMKARHVAQVGDKVRAVRLQTVRHMLQLAAEQQADFVIVAGDIFEDNQIDNQIVQKHAQHFRAMSAAHLYLAG